jgi:hypothetical protein
MASQRCEVISVSKHEADQDKVIVTGTPSSLALEYVT